MSNASSSRQPQAARKKVLAPVTIEKNHVHGKLEKEKKVREKDPKFNLNN